MNELQTYKAVQAARRHWAEGIRLADAAAHAARRYGVSRDAVIAYTVCASAACKQAMADLSDNRSK